MATKEELQGKVLAELQQIAEQFNARMDELFASHQLVLLPSAPVARLVAGEDHTQVRGRFLRYSTPISLAGVPALAIPCKVGGMQLAAARGFDESLLQLAARLGAYRKGALAQSRV